MLMELNQLIKIDKPIYSPTRNHNAAISDALKESKVFDFDMKIVEGEAYICDYGCQLTACLSMAYALALCKAGGAKRVFLAGFDGYDANDQRQQQMTSVLNSLRQPLLGLEIISLTPTTYQVTQGSVYAPY